MGRFSYTNGNRYLYLLVFALFVVVGVFVVLRLFTSSDGPGIVFTALWVAALAWNGYWLLWRISYRLEDDGDVLHWKTPLRSGEVPLSDVTAIRPGLLGQATVFEVNSHEDLMCPTGNGVSKFAAALNDRHTVTVTTGRLGGLIAFGSPDGFRRES